MKAQVVSIVLLAALVGVAHSSGHPRHHRTALRSQAAHVKRDPEATVTSADGDSMPVVALTFQIDNFNYVDLFQKVEIEVEDEKADDAANATLNYTIPSIPELNYTIPGYGQVKSLSYQVPPNASDETVKALVASPPGGWTKAMVATKTVHKVPTVQTAKVGGVSGKKFIDVEKSLAVNMKAESVIVQAGKNTQLLELKSKKLTTIKRVVTEAIETAVKEVVSVALQNYTKNASAFLQDPSKPEVRIFVSLMPGRSGRLESFLQFKRVGQEPEDSDADADDASSSEEAAAPAPAVSEPQLVIGGQATKVEVLLAGKPGNGVDEMKTLEEALIMAIAMGDMTKKLKDALYQSTGIQPRIMDLTTTTKSMENWDVTKCEGHLKQIVDRFTVAYTRRMVPTAVFNECTNYIPSASFSHDKHVNKADVHRCRVATAKFSEAWNFGKGREVAPPAPAQDIPSPAAATETDAANAPAAARKVELLDFKDFCFDVCEIKFGEDAFQCHITSGDALRSQPL